MKKWISLFLAALLVVGMAACSAPAAAPDAQAGQALADQPEASGEETVVVEAYIVQPDWSDAWDVMEARFEEQYPWIDVESVGMGASASDFISTRASVNDLPDVTQIDNNYMWQTLCDEGNIMDLTGRDVCQYIPQSYLDAYTYNGQLIGITQGAAFSTMYYNMQQLQQAGWNEPPKNWDELLRCCEDLQNAGCTPLTFAGDFPTSLWMVFELMIANEAGPQLGSGVYEAQFKDGTFDFTAYPALAERLDALRPYILPGTPRGRCRCHDRRTGSDVRGGQLVRRDDPGRDRAMHCRRLAGCSLSAAVPGCGRADMDLRLSGDCLRHHEQADPDAEGAGSCGAVL